MRMACAITDKALDRDNRFPFRQGHFHNVRMTSGIDLPAGGTFPAGFKFLIRMGITMQATGKLLGKTPLATPPGPNKEKCGGQSPGSQPSTKSFHNPVVSFDTAPAHAMSLPAWFTWWTTATGAGRSSAHAPGHPPGFPPHPQPWNIGEGKARMAMQMCTLATRILSPGPRVYLCGALFLRS